jgi:hypothetical protein
VSKDKKKELLVQRAQADFSAWMAESELLGEKLTIEAQRTPS